MKVKNLVAGLTLTAISLLMVACSGNKAASSTPTVDANMIYTQAAQTVAADMALTEAVQPTETATPTVAPTSTVDPTMAAAFTATANAVTSPITTPAGTSTTPNANTTPAAGLSTTPTAFKLATATQASAAASSSSSSADQATLVKQFPEDGQTMPTNAGFDMHLTLKNTGTTTWTTAYKLVYFAGERMGSPADLNMPHSVAPGESVTLVFSLEAPDSAGSKTIIWVMQNADGKNFYPLNHSIVR